MTLGHTIRSSWALLTDRTSPAPFSSAHHAVVRHNRNTRAKDQLIESKVRDPWKGVRRRGSPSAPGGEEW